MGQKKLKKPDIIEINGAEALDGLLEELVNKLADRSKRGFIEGQFPPWVETQADAEQYAVFRELKVDKIKEATNVSQGCGMRIARGIFCATLNSILGAGYYFLLPPLLGLSERTSMMFAIGWVCVFQADDMIRHKYGVGLFSPLKALRARKAMKYINNPETKPIEIINAEHKILNDFAVWQENKPLADILLGNEGKGLLQKYVWAPGRMLEKKHQRRLLKGIKNLLKHPGLGAFTSMQISPTMTVSQFIRQLHYTLKNESVRAHLNSTREMSTDPGRVLYINGAEEQSDNLQL